MTWFCLRFFFFFFFLFFFFFFFFFLLFFFLFSHTPPPDPPPPTFQVESDELAQRAPPPGAYGVGSNAIVLAEDKQYYPDASQVYGEGVETLVEEEDAQRDVDDDEEDVDIDMGRCELQSGTMTWYDAESLCHDLGMQLPIVTTAAQNYEV